MAHQKPRKNDLRKEIAALIDSIKHQSDRIGNTRDVPQVDIDLILHSIEQLHRKAVVFSYLNTLPETDEVEKPQAEQQREIKAPVAEVHVPEVKVPEPPQVEAPVVQPAPEVKAPAAIVPEPPKVEPPVVSPPVEVNVPEVQVPEPPKVAPTPVVPVPEVKAPEAPKLEAKPEPAKPVVGKDVRTMIGFNEKLMFMRSLFGGDAAAYDDALNQLNTTTSRDEAEAFVSMLQREFRWTQDSEPAEMFRNLVNRRFS